MEGPSIASSLRMSQVRVDARQAIPRALSPGVSKRLRVRALLARGLGRGGGLAQAAGLVARGQRLLALVERVGLGLERREALARLALVDGLLLRRGGLGRGLAAALLGLGRLRGLLPALLVGLLALLRGALGGLLALAAGVLSLLVGELVGALGAQLGLLAQARGLLALAGGLVALRGVLAHVAVQERAAGGVAYGGVHMVDGGLDARGTPGQAQRAVQRPARDAQVAVDGGAGNDAEGVHWFSSGSMASACASARRASCSRAAASALPSRRSAAARCSARAASASSARLAASAACLRCSASAAARCSASMRSRSAACSRSFSATSAWRRSRSISVSARSSSSSASASRWRASASSRRASIWASDCADCSRPSRARSSLPVRLPAAALARPASLPSRPPVVRSLVSGLVTFGSLLRKGGATGLPEAAPGLE